MEEFSGQLGEKLVSRLSDPTDQDVTLYDVYRVIGTQMVRVKLNEFDKIELKKSTHRFRSQKSLIKRITFGHRQLSESFGTTADTLLSTFEKTN